MADITLKDRQRFADNGYNNNRVTRMDAADDLVFAWVTQWDDSLLTTSTLSYRGEFNIIAKAIRQVLADLRANPVQMSFHPIDNASEDDAELIDGIYRTDDMKNSSQESYFNASQEAVSCGIGGWELYTEYESSNSKKQVLCRAPIHEYNNVVFWDPQSQLMDKSDAKWVVKLTRYSREGYMDLYRELKGEDHADAFNSRNGQPAIPTNFKFPQYSYAFPWMAGNYEWFFIGTTYYRERTEDEILTFIDPITQDVSEYYASEVIDRMDELVSQGLTIVSKRHVDRYVVTKYIDSGETNLYTGEIACEHIPVVPLYGERAFIEGQEVWRGLVKLAKDPQRLLNFAMSFIADITSRSPRPKPLFFPEQVAGYQDMFNNNGADNDFAYYLINRKTPAGDDLPAGTAGAMPEQQIPQSVGTLVQLATQSVRDTLPDLMNSDFADVELSGDAIAQLNGRVNQQSVVFQQNMKHSKRRDAEIALSFYSRIYDTARDVIVTKADNTKIKRTLMKMEIDKDSGEPVMKYNLKIARFNVSTEVGPSFQSQRDQARKELAQQIIALPPDDPMREVIQYAYATLLDGIGLTAVRKFANKQMVVKGYRDPETPQEEQWLKEAQQAQAQQPQDPMIAIEAQRVQNEGVRAQADMLRAHATQAKVQAESQHYQVKSDAKIFDSQTGRINAHTQQAKVVVDAANKAADRSMKQEPQMAAPPKPKQKTIGELHAAHIFVHPVHGMVSEKDIRDTMQRHGISRPHVLEKLAHHATIHNAMRQMVA